DAGRIGWSAGEAATGEPAAGSGGGDGMTTVAWLRAAWPDPFDGGHSASSVLMTNPAATPRTRSAQPLRSSRRIVAGPMPIMVRFPARRCGMRLCPSILIGCRAGRAQPSRRVVQHTPSRVKRNPDRGGTGPTAPDDTLWARGKGAALLP